MSWRGQLADTKQMDVTVFQGQHALSVDYNDSTTVTNWGQVRSANNIISIKNIRGKLKGIIRPKFQRVLYEGQVQNGYSPGSGWIAMQDSAVPHYGFKYHWQIPGYDAGAALPQIPWSYKVVHTVYYGIKNVQRSW